MDGRREDNGLRSALALLERYRRLADAGHSALRRYAGCAGGEVVFCLGTGPSLAFEDPGLLAGTNVVCTNHAHRFVGDVELRRGWSVVTDTIRTEQLLPELSATRWPTFIAPCGLTERWYDLASAHPEAHVLWARQCLSLRDAGWELAPYVTPFSRFDLDAELEHAGYSVIFAAIQLAVYIGARTIVLLGVDMDYGGSQTHFIPTLSHSNPAFDYASHARPAFAFFRSELSRRGITLLNATRGGRIDVLERVSFDHAARLATQVVAEMAVRDAEREQEVARREERRQQAGRGLAARVQRLRQGQHSLSEGRDLLLWGAGTAGQQALQVLARHGLRPMAVVDSDTRKVGSCVDGLLIRGPDALDEPRWRRAVLVVASMYAREIVDWLTARGWTESSIVVVDSAALSGDAAGEQTW